MHKVFYLILVLMLHLQTSNAGIQLTQTAKIMGSHFEITIVADDSLRAHSAITKAIDIIQQIEYEISEWSDTTLVGKLNLHAGKQAIKASADLLNLTKIALNFSFITKGAFDISVAAMDKIWKFDGSQVDIPDSQTVKNAIKNVGWQHIVIDTVHKTIFLNKPEMKIGFGSIGKSYAAQKVKEILQAEGIPGGLINAAGDIATWGTQANGQDWSIGIYDPIKEIHNKIIHAKNISIVTSGNYEKYIVINNKRYGHIINPSTGYPSTGIISATVWGPDATITNGISTSIMALGPERYKECANAFPAYSYYLILDNGKVIKSKGINWRKTINY